MYASDDYFLVLCVRGQISCCAVNEKTFFSEKLLLPRRTKLLPAVPTSFPSTTFFSTLLNKRPIKYRKFELQFRQQPIRLV